MTISITVHFQQNTNLRELLQTNNKYILIGLFHILIVKSQFKETISIHSRRFVMTLLQWYKVYKLGEVELHRPPPPGCLNGPGDDGSEFVNLWSDG